MLIRSIKQFKTPHTLAVAELINKGRMLALEVRRFFLAQFPQNSYFPKSFVFSPQVSFLYSKFQYSPHC